MDVKSAEVSSEPLKYQTWFLKVSIHCEGCRRKVKKVLRNIDGVFTATIEPNQQKVKVTGNVGAETLIKKLLKAGKHAEIWPENHDFGKGKTSGKQKNRNEQRDPETVENNSAPNAEPNLCSAKNRGTENTNNSSKSEKSKKSKDSKTGKNSPENSEAPESYQKGGEGEVEVEAVNGKSGEVGSVKKKKKKKKKVENGDNGLSSASSPSNNAAPAHTGSQFQNSSSTEQVVGQMNLSPTRQQSQMYPETYHYQYPPHLVYLAATYYRMCPFGNNKMSGPSSSSSSSSYYYVSPLPYMYSDPYHEFQQQSAPLVPFEIFSDENANGCSIM